MPEESQIPAGDAEKGKKIFKERCAQCHVLTINEHPKPEGPNLRFMFGKYAGDKSIPNKSYQYTEAIRRRLIVWSEKTLYDFLEDPMKYIPGTKMVVPGMKKSQDRADLVAYLKEATK